MSERLYDRVDLTDGCDRVVLIRAMMRSSIVQSFIRSRNFVLLRKRSYCRAPRDSGNLCYFIHNFLQRVPRIQPKNIFRSRTHRSPKFLFETNSFSRARIISEQVHDSCIKFEISVEDEMRYAAPDILHQYFARSNNSLVTVP